MTVWIRMCVLVVCGVSCSGVGVAQEKGNWRAESQTAKTVTGDIAISGQKIAINFSGYWIAQIRALTPAEASAAFNVDLDAGGRGNLYRLSIPGDKRFLHKNTLCGSEDVQWAVTYATVRQLQVALFSGNKMPEMTPDGMASATNLCGVFGYVR
jgi:hypothetical protein